MRLADFGWLMTGVTLNAVAQLALKNATGTTGAIDGTRQGLWTAAQQLTANVSFWLALLAYAISVAVWIVGLSRVPVSQAYPVLSVGYVITALLAWMLFGETVSVERWAGIGLIMVGVILVSSPR
jgi:multidrug transporter EmrE-like cation transporter